MRDDAFSTTLFMTNPHLPAHMLIHQAYIHIWTKYYLCYITYSLLIQYLLSLTICTSTRMWHIDDSGMKHYFYVSVGAYQANCFFQCNFFRFFIALVATVIVDGWRLFCSIIELNLHQHFVALWYSIGMWLVCDSFGAGMSTGHVMSDIHHAIYTFHIKTLVCQVRRGLNSGRIVDECRCSLDRGQDTLVCDWTLLLVYDYAMTALISCCRLPQAFVAIFTDTNIDGIYHHST